MRIVTVNTHDIEGGAARASFRLTRALRREGADAVVLCDRQTSDADFVHGPTSKRGRGLAMLKGSIDMLSANVFYRNRQKLPWGLGWKSWGAPERIAALKPDVTHLHWVSQGLISIKELGSLPGPVVWTMHDMWAMTGGCHYTGGCENYLSGCGSCPQLRSSKKNDLSRKIFERRLREWGGKDNLTLVAPSRWLAEAFEASKMFQGRKCHVIPNAIDTEFFHSVDQAVARRLLGLPLDKKLLIFSAMNSTIDPRKGAQFLGPMLEELRAKGREKELELVVLGASHGAGRLTTDFRVHYLGRLHDDVSLLLAYSAADVSLAPSTQENLALTVQESLACGTPCVAFRIGGMPDLIVSGKNGYLATPFDPTDLARGVQEALAHPEWRQAARDHVVEHFRDPVVARRYLEVYSELCKTSKR